MLRISCLVSMAFAAATSPVAANKFDTKTAKFEVGFHGHTSADSDMSAVVMPDATVTFEFTGGTADRYDLAVHDGVAVPTSGQAWRWTARVDARRLHASVLGPSANRRDRGEDARGARGLTVRLKPDTTVAWSRDPVRLKPDTTVAAVTPRPSWRL